MIARCSQPQQKEATGCHHVLIVAGEVTSNAEVIILQEVAADAAPHRPFSVEYYAVSTQKTKSHLESVFNRFAGHLTDCEAKSFHFFSTQ